MINPKTILIVDDDELMREVLGEIVSDQGARVLSADCGHAAFEMLSTHPEICAVLSDVMMPNGTGLELAQKMQIHFPHITLFLCSGHNELNPEEAKELGVEKIFTKPFDFRELNEALAKIVNS